MDGENEEDLTFLTLLNRARITKFLFFSFTLYIYNMLYGLSLPKIILLKMVVILCILGTQRVKMRKNLIILYVYNIFSVYLHKILRYDSKFHSQELSLFQTGTHVQHGGEFHKGT